MSEHVLMSYQTRSLLRILIPLVLIFSGCGDGSGEASQGGPFFVGGAGNGSAVVGGFTPGPGTGTPVSFSPGETAALPSAQNDRYAIEVGHVLIQSATTGVLSNDVPEGGRVSIPSVSAQGGALTGQQDGSFTYTAPTGFTGNDSFAYTLTNAQGSATAQVEITVSPRVFRGISVTLAGIAAGGMSGLNGTAINGDGSLVAFGSLASNLAPVPDTNGVQDIFLYNSVTNSIERISNTPTGGAPNAFSGGGIDMTPDGNLIVFSSAASNIVAGDTNGVADIFLLNRTTGVTEIVSLDSSGAQLTTRSSYPWISDDGRYISFDNDATTVPPIEPSLVRLRDRQLGTTTLVSKTPSGALPNHSSYASVLSSDGRWITMQSRASDLVLGDTNGQSDIFLYSVTDGTMQLISKVPGGPESNGYSSTPSIDGDGRQVAFRSDATNLTANDTNGFDDCFVFDRVKNSLTRVSTNALGEQLNSASIEPTLSSDGLYLSFSSSATNVVSNSLGTFGNVFVKDLPTGNVAWISKGPNGEVGDSQSGGVEAAFFSGNSRFLTFVSTSSNWLPGDTFGSFDVFETTNPFAR